MLCFPNIFTLINLSVCIYLKSNKMNKAFNDQLAKFRFKISNTKVYILIGKCVLNGDQTSWSYSLSNSTGHCLASCACITSC